MDMNQGSEKETSFKCPSCGMELAVEPKSEDEKEDAASNSNPFKKKTPPVKKDNASSIPMDSLKSKLPVANKPGFQSSNLNGY